MTSTPKRPRDPNQLAKMVVDIATGEKEKQEKRAPNSDALPKKVGSVKQNSAAARKE